MSSERSVASIVLRLTLIAACCGALLAGAYVLTHEKITASAARARLSTLHSMVAPGAYDNDLLASAMTLPEHDNQVEVFRATREGTLVRAIFEIESANGYSGPIRLMVAFDDQGVLRAARVVSHRETPGLGDVIEAEKSDWITQFVGHAAAGVWKLKADAGQFDAATGATVSSRAVVEALASAGRFFGRHQAAILSGAHHE